MTKTMLSIVFLFVQQNDERHLVQILPTSQLKTQPWPLTNPKEKVSIIKPWMNDTHAKTHANTFRISKSSNMVRIRRKSALFKMLRKENIINHKDLIQKHKHTKKVNTGNIQIDVFCNVEKKMELFKYVLVVKVRW